MTSLNVQGHALLVELRCNFKSLPSLDVQECLMLEKLNCLGNAIKGGNMEQLIESLPNRMGLTPAGVAVVPVVDYDINGHAWLTPQCGVNIVKMSNGTTCKMQVP